MLNAKKEDYEVIPTHEVFATTVDEEYDIRPRVWDAQAKSWTLLDTGSQVSVLKPSATDVLNPNLRLETVDGSALGCYGRKKHSIRLGRKTVNGWL